MAFISPTNRVWLTLLFLVKIECGPTEPVFFPRIWEGIFEEGQRYLAEGLTNKTVNTCKGHLAMYVDGLNKRQAWSIEMYDSTGKQGPGLLRGRVTWNGDFTQCLKVRQPRALSSTSAQDVVTGQYCSAMFEVPRWLIGFINDNKYPFDIQLPSLTVDLCVPAACSERDIENIVNKYLDLHVSANHTLHELKCHKTLDIRDDVPALSCTAVLLLISLFVILGSLIDAFLTITEPFAEEKAEMPIGFRQRAASLVSRAGSMFSRRSSVFSITSEPKRGSIYSAKSMLFKRQTSRLSTGSRDIKVTETVSYLPEVNVPYYNVSDTDGKPAAEGKPVADSKLGADGKAVAGEKSTADGKSTQNGKVVVDGKTEANTNLVTDGKIEEKGNIVKDGNMELDSVSIDSSPSAVQVYIVGEDVRSNKSTNLTNDEVDAVAKDLIQRQKSLKKAELVKRGVKPSLVPIKEQNGSSSESVEKKSISKPRHFGHSLAAFFLCFAIQRNLKNILGEGNPNLLFCLNGIRVLSITWIVLGNTVSFLYKEPNVVANVVEVAETTQSFIFQAVINGTFAADTFFILSGTLLAYNWMCKESKEKLSVKKLFLMYFHRLVRILPCYYVLILIYTNLLPYFGEGPRWKYTSKGIQQCKDHWWANALFISNFYKADDMCMAWTYYLVNDFQFYIISPIVLVPLSKCPPLGFFLLFLLVLTQIVSTAILNNNIHGNILRMSGGYFENVYAKPYCRVGVFAIGIALGYALYKAGRKIYFRKTTLVLGWCFALSMMAVMVFITYDENRVGGTHWTNTQTAVYEALCRPAWGLGVSWIIFCCCIGQGGYIDKILSWNFFLPLCRITYGIYLLHPLLIILIIDTTKGLIYIDFVEVGVLFLSILVCAVGLALVFIATVEGPFVRLEKLLFH